MIAKRLSNWRTDMRIVWAITAKDILEALKNKNAVSVVITALFIAVAYSFIPNLTALDNPTNVLVYDASKSNLGAQLKASRALEGYTYPSQAIMLEKLAYGEVPELGLVIPAGFDPSQAIEDGAQGALQLTGYVLYWVDDKEIASLTQDVEAEISRLEGTPVQIQVAEERVIPQRAQNSRGNWVGAALVFLVVYISLGTISNLMLEEKQTHTLEAILVSPASSWHVVTAKALSGLFYCLLGIIVTLVINYELVLHWWLIIPTLVVGALFSIALGLIAGSRVEERGQLALWTFGLLIPLFITVFLSLMDELLPQWLNQVIVLIPSVTWFQLIQASFGALPSTGTLLWQFAYLTAWAAAGLAGAIWMLHRQQQVTEGDRENRTRKVGASLQPGAHPQETPSTTPSPMKAHTLADGLLPIRPASGLRIVQAIAAKDIRQSIHNKLILSILLGTTLLVAGNALLLRGLSALSGSPSLVSSSAPVLAIMLSITLMTLGIALVPLLMVEEKEAHTLEALLVSPASYMQVVAGKAIAGAVYCLCGLSVILIAYNFLIVHWEVALLALLLGTAFVVALGLLLGMISNNPTTTGMWAAVIMLLMIVPAVSSGLGSLNQSPFLERLMTYWPSTAIVELFEMAILAEIPQGAVIWNASIVICASIALYLLTWWMVRRSDR